MPLQRVLLRLQRAGGASDSEQALTAKTIRLVTLEVRKQEPIIANHVKTESAQIWHCWCSGTDISHSLLKDLPYTSTIVLCSYTCTPDAIEVQNTLSPVRLV